MGVLLPLICLLLFYTKTFNIFQYLEESNKEVILQKDSGRSVFTDSRTGIYEDVVRDVLKAKEWWKPYIGLGGNGKLKSKQTEPVLLALKDYAQHTKAAC